MDKKNKIQTDEFTKTFADLAKVFILLATPAWYLTSDDNDTTKENTTTQELAMENVASIVDTTYIKAEPQQTIKPAPISASIKETYKIPNNAPKKALQQKIINASAGGDIDSRYLLLLATIESTLNERAKASKGSATGLYQFINQSWLEVINKHGAKYGLKNEANMIKKGVKDNPHLLYVNDKAEYQRILDMRYDPIISTYMAIEFTKKNKAFLENVLKEDATPTNLYTLHFLGKRNAAKFFKVLRKNPDWNPIDYFSNAVVKRNKAIFYFSDRKTPRSFEQIHRYFQEKLKKADKIVNPKVSIANIMIKKTS